MTILGCIKILVISIKLFNLILINISNTNTKAILQSKVAVQPKTFEVSLKENISDKSKKYL